MPNLWLEPKEEIYKEEKIFSTFSNLATFWHYPCKGICERSSLTTLTKRHKGFSALLPTNAGHLILTSKQKMKKITKVADLIGIVRTAKAGGQFASIEGEHTTKFNQFPNEDYCNAKGITLASGKGSKVLNEPYRFGGEDFRYRFKVVFHFGQDYDRTLERAGLTRSEQGANKPIDHFGGIAIGYPTTSNICLVYMQGDYIGDGYYLDGKKVEDSETLAYIAGYKSVSKPQAVEYRTIGVRNIRSVAVEGETYQVEITDITPDEYDALCKVFDAKRTEPKDTTDKGFNIAL